MSNTGHSASTSASSSSSQTGVTPAPTCTCAAACLHRRMAHGTQAIDDSFQLAMDPRETRVQGYMAAYVSSNTPTAQAPPAPPPDTANDEDIASSAHATVEWPDHQEQAWANQLLRGASTTLN